MYKKLVDFLSRMITENMELESKEKALFSFGLELVIGVVLEAIILLFLAYLFNIFWPVFIALLSFLVIRPYAGGIHLPTYFSCLIVTLLVFLLIGFIAANIQPGLLTTIIVIFFVAITGFIFIYKYAPADTKTIPISDPALRQDLKRKAYIVLIAWTILAITAALLFTGYLNLVIAASLGIFSQLISTHPTFFELAERYLPEHD